MNSAGEGGHCRAVPTKELVTHWNVFGSNASTVRDSARPGVRAGPVTGKNVGHMYTGTVDPTNVDITREMGAGDRF